MPYRQHEWQDRRAKVYERWLGIKQVGRQSSGRALPDGEADWCIAEYKCRRDLPSVIKRAFAQLERSTFPGDVRARIVILHAEGSRVWDDVLCIRLRDFLRLRGMARGPAPVHMEADSEGPGEVDDVSSGVEG